MLLGRGVDYFKTKQLNYWYSVFCVAIVQLFVQHFVSLFVSAAYSFWEKLTSMEWDRAEKVSIFAI